MPPHRRSDLGSAGFAYLEPKRHIQFVIELDGTEAETLGAVLARCTRGLKEATGFEIVYGCILADGMPHLHLHLAPHRPGDALNDQMIRGDITEETLPSGMTRVVSRQFPPLPVEELCAAAERIRQGMAEFRRAMARGKRCHRCSW